MRSKWEQRRLEEEYAKLRSVSEHDLTREQKDRFHELGFLFAHPGYDALVLPRATGSGLESEEYCYRPEVFWPPGAAVASSSCHIPLAGPDGQRDYKHGSETSPFCATEDEAVEWLLSRDLYGHVQRYKHTVPVADRDLHFRFTPTGPNGSGYWEWYRPYLTAGIACVVNPPERDTLHVSLMTALRGVKVVSADRTERTVWAKVPE